jgi:hypothetical protein
MPRLTYRQRHRRIRQSLQEAWSSSLMPAEDPGLREVYGTLPRAPIRLITSPLWIDVNQGGLLRLADAYRLESVDLSPEKDGARDFSGSMGAAVWQPYRWIETEKAILEAKAAGYRVYGLTLGPGSTAVRSAKWRFPAALVLGEEKKGLAPEVAARCDELVAIPMFGLMGSLNVGMAAAIAVYECVLAYASQNSDFQPARNGSRRLLGLPEADYSAHLMEEN